MSADTTLEPRLHHAQCSLAEAARLQSERLLDEDRHAYAHLPERTRVPSLAARALLRELLARLQGPGRWAEATLARRPQGSLWLPAAPQVGVSVSHSGEQFMAAVCEGAAVGIDIERVDPRFDGMALARRFFHPGEVARLARLPSRAQEDGFFRYWTAKEAVIKCLGDGLRIPLSSFRVDEPADGGGVQVGGRPVRVQVRTLCAPAGYQAAIAWAPGVIVSGTSA